MINPSQTVPKLILVFSSCLRGGENLRGGEAPSLFLLPSPAKKTAVGKIKTGWRGVRGEVK
jgi:hypothetical protein